MLVLPDEQVVITHADWLQVVKQAVRGGRIRDACRERLEEHGPGAVISCRFVLDELERS